MVVSTTGRLRSFVLWYGGAAGVLAACSLPLIWPDRFSGLLPFVQPFVPEIRVVLILLPLVACWAALRTAPYSAGERTTAWLFSLACAGFCEVVHYWVTDRGALFPVTEYVNNTAWQAARHYGIIRLGPGDAPHSYRFLPDCFVAIFQALTGDFVFARILYRLLFDSLLFAFIFRYARLYLTSVSAVAVMLLIVMLYPIGILRYAGQFVDPLSHASFAVCLYCLAAGNEAGFGSSLFVGVFAKESVIAMAICRAVQGPDRWSAAAKALGYFILAAAIAVAIRVHVNHGFGGGGNISHSISGTGLGQAAENIEDWAIWGPFYLATLGLLAPGAFLGWRLMDPAFKGTLVIVTVSVVVSSLLFSWLAEVRNLVPAFIPLAVVNLKYVETRWLQRR
jgi:hypothetical protein